jgi:hypothetical protein
VNKLHQIESEIAKLSPEEIRELTRWLKERQARTNGSGQNPVLSDLTGRLQWRGDAVAEQRRLRDEW